MEDRTPQRSLTLLLLPGGQTGIDAMAVASAWAAEGLLKRALWVTADQVQLSQFGTVTARGSLMDEGQASVHDVLEVLSRSRVELVTVVVVQVVQAGQPLQADQRRAAESLVQAIDHSRPEVLDPGGQERPIDVVRLNLLCAPTGTTRVGYGDATFQLFNGNLLASPEDRRAADQMDQFVRQGENLIPWSVAQAATIGGVWSGMPEGPWRLLRGAGDDSSIAQGEFVIPVRGFARVVTSAPTARRALALAMQEIRDQSSNILSGSNLIPTAEPAQFLDATLDAFDRVDGARLDYATPQPEPDLGQEKVPLSRASRDFLAFSKTELAAVPRFVARRSSAKWSARATKTLSGPGGNEIVTVRGESPDVLQFTLDFERQSVEAERQLDGIKSGLPPAAPVLWRSLRATAFGLLDGSSIPEPMPTPIVADQRVVIPATTLIAPPTKEWTPDGMGSELHIDPGDLPVPAGSPWHADRVHHQIAEQVDSCEAALADSRVQLESARQALRDWEAGAAFPQPAPGTRVEVAEGDGGDPCPECGADPHGEDQCPDCGWVAAGGHEEAGEPSTDVSPVDKALHKAQLTVAADHAQEAVERGERRLRELRKHSESFNAWLRDRDQSLLWRLAQRIQNRTIQAGKDAAAFRREAVSVPDIDRDEPLRARNQFARRLITLGSLALVAIVLLWRFGGMLSELTSLPAWSLWLALVVVVLTILVMVLLSNYRRRSRFVAQLRELRHRQLDAQRRSRDATHAENKLNGLYQQLVEWNELLGHAIHDPLHPEESWFSGLPSAELAANLPTCVDLAVPDPDDVVGTRRLQRAALESITAEGWRTRTFNRLLDLSMAGQAANGEDADSARIDMDAPATPNGTRRLMRDRLRSGELQVEAARSLMRSKAAGLYSERKALMSHALRPVNSEYAAEATDLLDEDGGLEKLRPSWGDFLTGALNGSTQFSSALWSDLGSTNSELRLSMNTLLFAPPGMETESRAANVQQIPAAPADKNRGVELSVRVDVGLPAEARMLRIFSHDELVHVDPIQPDSTRSSGNGEGVSAAAERLDLADFN